MPASYATDGPPLKKLRLSDEDINNFIVKVQTAQVKSCQEMLTSDDLLSISYVMSEFIDAVGKIKDYPSQHHVKLFKAACHDKNLITALTDPYVSLALELKKAYDLGELPCCENVLKFEQRHKFDLRDESLMNKFWEVSLDFMPDLIELTDVEFSQALDKGEFTPALIQKGMAAYDDIVSTFIDMRFPDRESTSDIMLQLTSARLAKHWALSYGIVRDDCKIPAADVFYGYIGALALVSVVPPQRERLTTWVSILIEPIVMSLEGTLTVSETAKLDLAKELTAIEYRLVHTAEIDEPVFIVQAWAGNGALMVGMASASTVSQAESNAACVALYKKSRFDRLRETIQQFSTYYGTFTSTTVAEPQATVLGTAASQPESWEQPFQQSSFGNRAAESFAGPPRQAIVQATRGQPKIPQHAPPMPQMVDQQPAAAVPNHEIAISTVALTNEFQQQIDSYPDIDLADPVLDADIDNSSKEKLNRFLIDNRYEPAEYKTFKATNSGVQVTCIVENIALVRAISTNKKKAGQTCAQFILNYLDYFLQKLPPR